MLNVLVQIANKMGLQKKEEEILTALFSDVKRCALFPLIYVDLYGFPVSPLQKHVAVFSVCLG
jgi:hypothetical protein